jgi:hypothetical protein
MPNISLGAIQNRHKTITLKIDEATNTKFCNITDKIEKTDFKAPFEERTKDVEEIVDSIKEGFLNQNDVQKKLLENSLFHELEDRLVEVSGSRTNFSDKKAYLKFQEIVKKEIPQYSFTVSPEKMKKDFPELPEEE